MAPLELSTSALAIGKSSSSSHYDATAKSSLAMAAELRTHKASAFEGTTLYDPILSASSTSPLYPNLEDNSFFKTRCVYKGPVSLATRANPHYFAFFNYYPMPTFNIYAETAPILANTDLLPLQTSDIILVGDNKIPAPAVISTPNFIYDNEWDGAVDEVSKKHMTTFKKYFEHTRQVLLNVVPTLDQEPVSYYDYDFRVDAQLVIEDDADWAQFAS